MRGLLAPTLLLIAIGVIQDVGGSGQQLLETSAATKTTAAPPLALFITGLASIALSALFAVSAFRILLLKTPPTLERWGLLWTPRESRFVGAAIAVTGLSILPIILVSSAVMPFFAPADPLTWSPSQWSIFAVTLLPGAWIFSRLAIVLPTVAMGRPLTLKEGWALSAGNGWRLMLIAQGPALLISLGTTWLQWEPSVPPNPISTVAAIISTQLSTLLGIAALSVASHQLTATNTSEPP